MQKVKEKRENCVKKSLGELLESNPQYGYTTSATQEDVGPKFFRITDIKSGKVDWNSVPNCKIEEREKNKYLLHAGDIVFARTGSTGLTYFFKKEPPHPSIFASYLIRIRPNLKKCLPGYLYYFFHSRDYWQQVAGNSSGSVQRGLNASKLKHLNIPVPSLSTQQKIVEVLDAVQNAVEIQDKLIKKTQQLKQSTMHKLFTEGTRGEKQKKTKIGTIPESWEVIKIEELFKFTSGKSRPKYITNEVVEEYQFPVYGGNGILGYAKNYFVEKPVLVIGRVGAYCGVVDSTNGNVWISDNALFTKDILKSLSLEFYKNFFKIFDLNRFRRTGGQPLITQGSIGLIEIPYPPLEEQKEIAHILQTIDKKIEIHKDKKEKHEELFRSLLHKLMGGEIEVNKLNI